jgi:SAM-dependent methyltransferase
LKIQPYEKVAVIFDFLMKKLDYESWSNYILEIANTYLEKNASLLELGAGTCKIAEYISKRYKNYIATDISLQMLNYSKCNAVKKVCCDMKALPFKNKYDFIFSNFDCVNYLLKQKHLAQLFEEVFYLLKRDGIFTFDISLENNSLNFQKSKSVEGSYEGYSFKRVSHYNKLSRIHTNKFLLSDKYGKYITETHKEKIYKIETFFRLADKAGLTVEACYDCFTFNDIKPKSERAQFVMRKMN